MLQPSLVFSINIFNEHLQNLVTPYIKDMKVTAIFSNRLA